MSTICRTSHEVRGLKCTGKMPKRPFMRRRTSHEVRGLK